MKTNISDNELWQNAIAYVEALPGTDLGGNDEDWGYDDSDEYTWENQG